MPRADASRPRSPRAALALAVLLQALGAACGSDATSAPPASQVRLVGTSAAGAQSASDSQFPALSGDGRIVAFVSFAGDLSPLDNTALFSKIFVKNPATGALDLASAGLDNAAADGNSTKPSLDGPGARVAFVSDASNLVGSDTNGVSDVFLRNLASGTTRRVSEAADGGEADAPSSNPRIDNAATRVVFESTASNLSATPNPGIRDVYLKSLADNGVSRVSEAEDGTPGNGNSLLPAISADGRFAVFYSIASNLVADDGNGAYDLFAKNLDNGSVERVGLDSAGREIPTGTPPAGNPAAVSATGRFVAFQSAVDNLVAADRNGFADIFVRDRQSGTLEIVSVSNGGASGNGKSEHPAISHDGRYVVFRSYATNFDGTPNPLGDVFVRDRQAGTTRRLGKGHDGSPANDCPGPPAIGGDGAVASFASRASNLVTPDSNGTVSDIFLAPIRP